MTSTPSTESANGNTTAGMQSQFVERRRAALERFLNRVAQHPVLCIDPDFREFLESGKRLYIKRKFMPINNALQKHMSAKP